MIVSILECSTHGKQGIIAVYEIPLARWWARVGPTVLSSTGPWPSDPPVLCRSCDTPVQMWMMK